jgi:hypothetical protein
MLLKPDDGRAYPHLTFMGTRDLTKLHFTSAAFNGAQVSVIRCGYRWNGMHSVLQDDPEFAQNEQLLPVKHNDGHVVTFDLSGGRKNQQIAVGAVHVACPSVAALVGQLNIPHG